MICGTIFYLKAGTVSEENDFSHFFFKAPDSAITFLYLEKSICLGEQNIFQDSNMFTNITLQKAIFHEQDIEVKHLGCMYDPS
jgi:hypothetical protein